MYCMFPKVLTIVVIICMFFPEQITILNGMGVTGQIEGKVKIHSFILFLVLLIFFFCSLPTLWHVSIVVKSYKTLVKLNTLA